MSANRCSKPEARLSEVELLLWDISRSAPDAGARQTELDFHPLGPLVCQLLCHLKFSRYSMYHSQLGNDESWEIPVSSASCPLSHGGFGIDHVIEGRFHLPLRVGEVRLGLLAS